MNCHDLESWMMSAETPQRPSSEVRRHLRSCAGCRRRFGRLVRLIPEGSAAPLPLVPAAARDRLLARLEPRPAVIPLATPVALPLPRARPLPGQRWGRLAAAALLFIGLGL